MQISKNLRVPSGRQPLGIIHYNQEEKKDSEEEILLMLSKITESEGRNFRNLFLSEFFFEVHVEHLPR